MVGLYLRDAVQKPLRHDRGSLIEGARGGTRTAARAVEIDLGFPPGDAFPATGFCTCPDQVRDWLYTERRFSARPSVLVTCQGESEQLLDHGHEGGIGSEPGRTALPIAAIAQDAGKHLFV